MDTNMTEIQRHTTLMLVLQVTPKSLYITVCTSEIPSCITAELFELVGTDAKLTQAPMCTVAAELFYEHCRQVSANSEANVEFTSNRKELFICMPAILRLNISRRFSNSDAPFVLCVLDFCTISPYGSRSGQLYHPGAHSCRHIPKR